MKNPSLSESCMMVSLSPLGGTAENDPDVDYSLEARAAVGPTGGLGLAHRGPSETL
jgi:hypothetical protein